MFRWKITIIIQFIVLSLLFLPEDSPAIEDVGKWKRYEVSYSNTTWSGNPFDLVLDGVFTHTSSGESKTVPGFYAGNNIWKIFFMPDKLGEWTFTTTSVDLDLNGKTGSLICVESGLPGRLIPVGNRWKYEDGNYTAPILAYAGHGWFREENGYTDFDEFLVFASDILGSPIIFHNFGRYDMPLDGTGEVWLIEGEEFNIPMFDRMNQRFDELRDAGIGKYFFLYSDDSETPPWGGQSTQEKRYFKYMVARFSAYPTVSWDTGTDIGEYRNNNWINWFADYIKQIDPYDHPVSSRSGGGSGGINPSGATYYSDGRDGFINHSTWLNTWNSRSLPTTFTDVWSTNVNRGGWDFPQARRAIWELGLTGGPGMAFGANYYLGQTLPYQQRFEVAPYIGYANTFFKQSISDLGALDPHDELVISGSNVVLSADPGNEYVAYLNTGGTVQIDLSHMSGSASIEWFNPRTGVFSGQANITGGGTQTLSASDTNDWVLHITGGPSDSTPPTIPEDLNAVAQSESRIDLDWLAAEDPESGINKYKVFRDNVLVAEPALNSFSDTGLNEGTTYTYAVSALNSSGLGSEKSTPVLATTMKDVTPPTLTSVSATNDSTHVTVGFSEAVEQASAEDISNYTINNGITLSGASLGTDFKTLTLTTSSHATGVTYTLTVNNIKDRATLPNTINANTETTYKYFDQIVITNLTVNSGNTYEVVEDGLQVSAHVYTDRGYTFTSIPSLIQGATYIQTANDDKSITDLSFLTFDVSQNVTLYIAHDDRSPLPLWMISFSDTGYDLITSDATLSTYAKDFPSGTVVLGGNEGSGASMYSVMIQGASSTDTVSPKPPTKLRKKE